MPMNKPVWGALFSQTGSEIYNISKTLKREPDFIITNKTKEQVLDINQNLFFEQGHKFVWLPKKPTVEDYKQVIPQGALITLHGWLRIIPPEICELYEIYNLHPAPIHLEGFEKYKGKDPQVRIFEDKAIYSGNVIHKCIAELDAGEILAKNEFDVTGASLDKIFELTHSKAGELWCRFLQNRV
jgi:folate-dependent phosphoribosylglycinamide formyltransferase PurN